MKIKNTHQQDSVASKSQYILHDNISSQIIKPRNIFIVIAITISYILFCYVLH